MIAPLQPDDPPMIGPYRLIGQLGRGGMGQVFLGHSADGQPIAVKVIRAELAADREFRARFREEVAAARKVSGIFTALVVDADLDGQVPWLATTYIAGPSLAEEVESKGPLPANKVLWLAAGLAEGLNAIHAAGVIHGDLKPSNVLLSEDGPQVIDFGISQAREGGMIPDTHFGSPRFMSPEHALGQPIGPPSDIFSLGAVLTFATTGQGPFGSGSSATLIYRLVNSPARLDSMPAELRELVASCLAKDPHDRPAASSLLTQLAAIQRQTGWCPEPAFNVFTEGQQAAGTEDTKNRVEIPALAVVSPEDSTTGLSIVKPQPGSARRDLRHRFSRSLPVFALGYVAAFAVAIYFLIGVGSSPAVTPRAQAGTAATTPAAQAQPEAADPATSHATVTGGHASGSQDRIGTAVTQGPGAVAFLIPSSVASALTVPSPSGSVTPSISPSQSSSPSPSRSPSPSPSRSSSSSPSPSSSSPAPSPSSSSPAPSPSSSSPAPSPSSSSSSTPATSTPSTSPATSTSSA